jgi:tyrosyl-tRNA synthetase
MNAMVPGLAGGKMSSSDPNSKIDFLDGPDVVKKKIKAAFCEEGNVAENGILAFIEAVLIPISQLRRENIKMGGSILEKGGDLKPFASDDAPEGTVFSIERDEKFGGSTHYACYEDLKNDFAEKKLHPKDLKATVVDALNRLLDPIRKAFAEDEEAQKIEKLAYPDPNAKEKKVKKVSEQDFVALSDTESRTAESVPPPAARERQDRHRSCRRRRIRNHNCAGPHSARRRRGSKTAGDTARIATHALHRTNSCLSYQCN